jgi:hypothetical protein
VKRRKDNWIDHILCRNCLLKHVIEGKIKEIGRLGKGCKQLLDDLEDTRGCWILKQEALDRILWINRVGKGYGPVVRNM